MYPDSLELSAIFIDFLSYYLSGNTFPNELWPDQISEIIGTSREMRARAAARLELLLTDDRTSLILQRMVAWMECLLTGDGTLVSELNETTDFIAVVGIPRTGGSYITAELLSSLGYAPSYVPASIAHDGFPEVRQPGFDKARDRWSSTIQSISEYLVAMELFYNFSGPKRIVPKKFTKAIYSGSFINSILGPAAKYVITIRNPIDCCISTYEKSGGLVINEGFQPRSTIERWMVHETKVDLRKMPIIKQDDYIDIYIRYWIMFYSRLALSGLINHNNHEVLVFGKQNMESCAAKYHKQFASGLEPSSFQDSASVVKRHNNFIERAEAAIETVNSVWKAVGLDLPQDVLIATLRP